jgi:hypothetical protein
VSGDSKEEVKGEDYPAGFPLPAPSEKTLNENAAMPFVWLGVEDKIRARRRARR